MYFYQTNINNPENKVFENKQQHIFAAMPCAMLYVNHSDAFYGVNASFTDDVTVTCNRGYHVNDGVTSFNPSCVLSNLTSEVDVMWSKVMECTGLWPSRVRLHVFLQ